MSKLKLAIDHIRIASKSGEKVTGVQLKELYGVSRLLIPVMIKAGYIKKVKGFRYQWKVQDEVLPSMIKRIQNDITETNMMWINKHKSAPRVEIVRPVIQEKVRKEVVRKEKVRDESVKKTSIKLFGVTIFSISRS